MPSVDKILSRVPQYKIEELLPDSVTDVLEALERESFTSERKVEIALKVRPPDDLLRNSKTRNLLINYLDEDEITDLANSLGITYDAPPYKEVKASAFWKKSSSEKILFDFFDTDIPKENDERTSIGLLTVSPEYGLFDYQRRAQFELKEYLNSDDNRVFLHMPTGSGKTRVSMNVVADILIQSNPSVVLWLAEGTEILDQGAAEFENAWSHLGNRDIEISRFYGSYNWQEIEDGFIVAGVQKLWNKEKNSAAFLANFASKISLVVFDEAHRSTADTYKKMINRIVMVNKESGLLGLSATPGRTWNDPEKDRELAELYNRNKVSIDIPSYDDPFDFLVSEGYLSQPNFNELKIDNSLNQDALKDLRKLNPDQDYPNSVLDVLAEDDLRNLRIINKIMELISDGHSRIIVFATTVDHAKTISAILEALEVDSSVITSETPNYRRDEYISDFRNTVDDPQVLCNYNVLTTGFDAPNTSAAVISRPTKSLVLYSQMVGRAIRGPMVGGTETAEIWTVIDTDLPGFGSLSDAFWNWEDVW